MSGWQPIKTAPKDGTLILVSDGTRVTTAAWGGLLGVWLANDDIRHPQIAYWMPLPDPPQAKGQDDGR